MAAADVSEPGRNRRTQEQSLRTTAAIEVHAQRGAAGPATENTLAAFERAAELGAGWIELDVQRCGSGDIVVILDPDLGRLAGRPEAIVAELPLRALQAIELGSGRIPALSEVIEALRGRVRFHVEVKEYGLRGDGTATGTAALLARMLPADEVLVSSYNPFALARVARAAPQLPRGLIHPPEGGVPGPRRALRDRLFGRPWSARALGVRAVLPRWQQLDEAGMRWARRHQLRVVPWAVDDEGALRRVLALGVDGIVTNRPGWAVAALGDGAG